ncbi:MAG: DUF4292 domain-containing protein [Bacteroidaceae bacterium]|nr:DUF4292 domain-containing protein [Bacteroidaceae bacterium]
MIKRFICCCICILFVTACKTSRQAENADLRIFKTHKKDLKELLVLPNYNQFSAKMKIAVQIGDKDFSGRGTFKIIKNKQIQFSFAPILGIELARLELTPDSLLLVDRIHKRYVNDSFVTLSDLLRTKVDFYQLQALLLNTIYVPTTSLRPRDLQKQVSSTDSLLLLSYADSNYRFYVDNLAFSLKKVAIQSNGSAALLWKYADIQGKRNERVSTEMSISILHEKRPFFCQLSFSRLNFKQREYNSTHLSSSYEQIKSVGFLRKMLGL